MAKRPNDPGLDARGRMGGNAGPTSLWLKTAWFTSGETDLAPVRYDRLDTLTYVSRLAVAGSPPLLDEALLESASSGMVIVQRPDPGRHGAGVLLGREGQLSIAQEIPQGESPFADLVTDRLRRAWSFAAAWWHYCDPDRTQDPLVHEVGYTIVPADVDGLPNDLELDDLELNDDVALLLTMLATPNYLDVVTRPVRRALLDDPRAPISNAVRLSMRVPRGQLGSAGAR